MVKVSDPPQHICPHFPIAYSSHCVQELENFHSVLSDISYGRSTKRVKDFITQAFVKGARCGNAHNAELEGSTAVFSKRRFRDRCVE
jgi:hypothetical protein